MTSKPIIAFTKITKQFPGVLALDDVGFSIFPGEVHAVLGENGAGKSTLMNILAGELQPDAGDIHFRGERVTISNPVVSQRLGISVVFQELALCPNLSITENIALSSTATRSPLSFFRRQAHAETARESLASLGITYLNPKHIVGSLTVAQQQLVEIAKAISQDVRVLVLDEPNSALTIEETEHLFNVINTLREQGVAIIYVSHRLEEVVRISDRITVMRDGRHVDTFLNDGKVGMDGLIQKMVGRNVELFRRESHNTAYEATAFELRGMSGSDVLRDVSFSLRRGEVLGVAGLPGAGKHELVESVFGLRPYEGEIIIEGNTVRLNSPIDAIENGMALIPADRRQAGALLVMNVEDNTVAASLKDVNRLGFLDRATTRNVANEYIRKLDTRVSGLKQKMSTLSGGNQQKVIIGRGLATNPSVLILHEPTRGIDVGAKSEIYSILQELAREGVAVLIVSSELPELISQCDRILVLYEGEIAGIFDGDEATEEMLLSAAMGQHTETT